MRVSVVVPTYNRQALLDQTLTYLSAQQLPEPLSLEVVVVDDGSQDETAHVVDSFRERLSNLIYVYRQRDPTAPSCLSKVRNQGISRATGELITFLDCGVLVPPTFTKDLAQRSASVANRVVIHYVFGIGANRSTDKGELLDLLSPSTIAEVVKELGQSEAWIDPREGLFDLASDRLDRLPAPWTFCWGGFMTVSRQLLDRTGWFDETFYGWGSEDTDFAYRLYCHGASFVAGRDCFMLHLPHEVSGDNWRSNFINRKRIHKKHWNLETELYPFYYGPYYNQVLARFNHLVLADVLPQYSLRLLTYLNRTHLHQAGSSLLIGSSQAATIRQLQTSDILVHNKAMLARLEQALPERKVLYLLGCDTPYADLALDIVIVTDFLRLLPSMLRKELLREVCRIGRLVVLLYTEGYTSALQRLDDYPWASEEEIRRLAGELGLSIELEGQIGQVRVLKIVPLSSVPPRKHGGDQARKLVARLYIMLRHQIDYVTFWRRGRGRLAHDAMRLTATSVG
jgi:glycosyltransferase involved in cell wall biosynthesis